MGPGFRRGDDAERRTARPKTSFKHHEKFLSETTRKTSRSSVNDDAVSPTPDGRRCFHRRRMVRQRVHSSGDKPMSKRIALLSAAAFAALALTATIAAPVYAQEKTVMVGG